MIRLFQPGIAVTRLVAPKTRLKAVGFQKKWTNKKEGKSRMIPGGKFESTRMMPDRNCDETRMIPGRKSGVLQAGKPSQMKPGFGWNLFGIQYY